MQGPKRDSDARRDNIFDPPLGPFGRNQCADAAYEYQYEIMPNLHCIFVSPLRRALQTAYFLFKDHPRRKEIEVIMVPDLRDVLAGPWDIPNPIEKIVEDAKDMFYNLDTSLLDLASPDPDLWFLKNTDPK